MTTRTMDVDAIPVRIIKEPEESTQLASSLGQTTNILVPLSGTLFNGIGNGVQILQRRPTRYKAVITVQSIPNAASAPVGTTVTASGVVTNPGAAGLIASISAASLLAVAPAGSVWNINWIASLQGTVAAGDANNMEVVMPLGTVREVGIFPGVVGNYPQGQIQLTPAAGQNITVTAVAAASGVSAIYAATITATLVSVAGGGSVIFASRLDNLSNVNNPIGFQVTTVPYTFQWENQEPLYAIALGGGNALVSFIDQSELAWQSPAEESVEAEGLPYEEEQESSGTYYDSTANRY